MNSSKTEIRFDDDVGPQWLGAMVGITGHCAQLMEEVPLGRAGRSRTQASVLGSPG
ncbi:hypothetical protein [Changpingibacter yushuensis]|uniref:hypothetical protein n=1 Tax=Changpingibacter yushuensis TaxID=2758440 RepID=UPI00165DA17D|nr:hypothetical protein [Changpingibacter yushuensis]